MIGLMHVLLSFSVSQTQLRLRDEREMDVYLNSMKKWLLVSEVIILLRRKRLLFLSTFRIVALSYSFGFD